MLERQRAPAFASGAWLNGSPQALAGLRGQVVLLDFWDYTCVNCLRALPYLKAWYERYTPLGLTIIGVHVPGFAFGRERSQVEAAVRELDIPYPILMDNDFKTSAAYDNLYIPSRCLIDQHGMIAARAHGEGDYAAFERTIQTELRAINPDVSLPDILPPLRVEDDPACAYLRPTPELRGGFERGALGNPEGYAGSAPILYALPQHRVNGAFYVAGAWQAGYEFLTYRGTTEGVIQLPYEAVEVNAVFSPHHDTVERMLHPEAVSVEVWQDDQPLDQTQRGDDITEDGRVIVERPRLYNLIRNRDFEQHELTLRVKAQGFTLYAFSFVGGCKQD